MSAAAAMLEVNLDPQRLSWEALKDGWGDGLPLIPPTPELVAEYVQASALPADHVVGEFTSPPARCTVELVAVNTVMAGAPPESMPMVCTALQAMLHPAFDLAGVNATTASNLPVVVVNGPIRERLDIPCGASLLGGNSTLAPSMGRAIRLVMRNVAGQSAGVTSEAIFGQPGRVAGAVFGEWEERSPWPSLAERRGVADDAVTVFASLGSCNVLAQEANTGREVLEVIGKSLAYLGNNNFHYGSRYAEQMILINPIWAADVIGRDVPDFDDVRQIIWENAHLPIDWFPETLRPGVEARGRLDSSGRVRLMDSPDELHIVVCGGLGNLHGMMLPGFSHSEAVTLPVPS